MSINTFITIRIGEVSTLTSSYHDKAHWLIIHPLYNIYILSPSHNDNKDISIQHYRTL